ncbi:TetR family transcriptional regulator [Castellaniella sp.]|uniref:TetR family transcriptional regulator n=1 Tax=Castellaniella sp. TaxID=1955812 RepID=UPI003567D012
MTKTISIREDVHNLRKQRILDVASDLFYENGYNGARIDQIADRLGVTKPFIYYHFKSKADILAEVCGRTTAIVAGIAETSADTEGPVEQRLHELVRQLALEITKGHKYLAVYFREEKHLPEKAAKKLSLDRRRFNDAIARLLREGQASGAFQVPSVSIVTQAITGMCTWIFNWYRPTGSLSAEGVADMMADLALSMVRPA